MKKSFLFSVGVALLSTACGPAEPEESQHPFYGEVTRVTGDMPCPSGYVIATPDDASAFQSNACGMLASWDIARLTGSGAMRGPGYGCTVSAYESKPLGHTLCKSPSTNTFLSVTGDSPCGPGRTLLTVQEAAARQSEICAKLNTWDIARLEGGGSMGGPGYGCTISTWDTQGLSLSLCTAAEVDTIPQRLTIQIPRPNQQFSTPQLVFLGTAKPGSTVGAFIDGVQVGNEISVNERGYWEFHSPRLKWGTHKMMILVMGQVGSISDPSVEVVFDIVQHSHYGMNCAAAPFSLSFWPLVVLGLLRRRRAC